MGGGESHLHPVLARAGYRQPNNREGEGDHSPAAQELDTRAQMGML